MPILGGLISSSELSSRQSQNFRRKVFYQFPQSKAPLTGLLSLMEDMEDVALNPFGWFEERWILPRDVTVAANAAGPFTDTSNVDKTSGGWTSAAGTTVRVSVVDASKFRVRDVVQITDVPGTASSVKQFRGIVAVAETTTDEYIDVVLTETVTNALNDSTANALGVLIVGSASGEGERSVRKGQYKFPTEISNYTQIFRTTIGPFTRNAMGTSMKFDSEGHYKKTAKDAMIDHAVRMEQATFWGQRISTTTVNDDGETVPLRTTGGMKYFIEQWELQTIAVNGGAFDYGEAGATSVAGTATFPTAGDPTIGDERKRNWRGLGSITRSQFDTLVATSFRFCGNQGFQKLIFGGYGFLSVINDYLRREGVKMDKMNSKEETYGLEFMRWSTVHGEWLFKSHPLFNENPDLKNSGFVVDLGSIGWHDFVGADSEIREHIEANDYDGRKDEWLGEGGVELKFPERFAFIGGLTQITT